MLSADSRTRRRRCLWRRTAILGALVVAGGYVGCGFPNYTYDDNAFYDAGVGGGNTGTAGMDASAGTGGSTGGTGGSTGGTGGSTGGIGGSTGGTGGGTGNENCTNGKDDDGDSLIDCADPDCANAGYLCQTIPASWGGPVALYTGGYAKTPPACDVTGNYPSPYSSAYLDPSVLAQCQCSCGAATGVACAAPTAGLYSAASCGTGTAEGLKFSTFAPGDCVHFSQNPDAGVFTSQSANVPSTVSATGGSCAPGKVVVTLPAPWKQKARACALPASGWKAGGCTGTQICVPPAPSPFTKGTCIYKIGDVACPSPGVFTNKVVLYDSQPASDTRACTACQCGAPAGNCSGSVELWTSGGCNGTPNSTVDLAGTCQPFASTNDLYAKYQIDANQTGVTCAPSAKGGQPTGSVTPAGPMTFCCL